MNPAEDFFTDLVHAIAACVGASLREMDGRVQGNFKARIAAQSISQLAAKVPARARNAKTIKAVYEAFAASLNGKPETAPSIPLPPSASAKARKTPSQQKRTS